MRKLNKRQTIQFNENLGVLWLEHLTCMETSRLLSLGVFWDKLAQLVTLDTRLSHLAAAANVAPLTSRQQMTQYNCEKKAEYLVWDMGFKSETNRDPRGRAIMIYLPSGKSNSWDGVSYRPGIL